jgi:uncharacterized protein (TIGR03435 family)
MIDRSTLITTLAVGLAGIVLYGSPQQPNGTALQPSEIESLKVATLKRNPAGLDAPRFDFHDGVNLRITAASLLDLIRYAYDRFNADPGGEIMASQVQDGPAWISTLRYDISFRVDGRLVHDTLSFNTRARLMLRALLTERFQLKLHWDVQPMSGYILSVASGGPKLQEFTPWNWPMWLTAPKPLGPHNFACVPHEQDGQKYIGVLATGMPLSRMVTCLSNQLQAPIRDETELSGSYNFRILAVAAKTSSDPRYPTLFEALHNQLGLDLRSTELPTEIIHIDNAVVP